MNKGMRIAGLVLTVMILVIALIQLAVLLERICAAIWAWYKFYGYDGNGYITVGATTQLVFYIISSLATAVNLGLVLYDLNGRRRTISKELGEAAQKLLEYIAANGPCFEKACRILSLLVCFSFYSKKSIKNQIFLEKKVKIEQIENKLKLEDSKYRDPSKFCVSLI